MRFTPRRAAGAVAGLLAVSGLALAPAAHANADFALDRVAGQDRYETAAEIAQLAFPSGSDAVVLARGDAFPDALAGSYLTGVLGAPVLLTQTDAVPDVTSEAITALGADTIYLLGGTGAISQGVEDDLKADHTVTRVAGNDRYGTAAKIATTQAAGGIGETTDGATALLASGASFADALAAGPLAHAGQFPILLTAPGSLPTDTKAALDSLGIDHVIVLGGTAAVSEAVVSDVKSTGATTERVAGTDRYGTAAKIADFALKTLPDWNNDAIDLATGLNFADALAAGPAAGEAQRSILLTTPAALSKPTADWLLAHSGTLIEGRVYGGTAAVSNAVIDAAEAAGQGQSGGALQGQLTFIDKGADFYRFVPEGANDFETVQYETGDTFTVNGVNATIGGFEGAATPADTIRYVPASGSTPARHELTDVAASSITSGTVGNVDTADNAFDIINKVSGDALVADIDYNTKAYKIDGATADQTTFEKDINEGDAIAITTTGTTKTFELTNTAVTGPANDITISPDPNLPAEATFKIGELGDIPTASSDGPPDPSGNDDVYSTSNNPVNGTDTFTVDGIDGDFVAFAGALSQGDQVTYTRVGDVQHFALLNTPPSSEKGQAVDDLNTDGDNNPTGVPTPEDEDGGSFTLATATGEVDVAYGPDGTFVVDGSVASEGEFEAAYSAGDAITYRPADDPSGTTQRLEVDNRNLSGAIDPASVHTEDSVAPPATANSYGVLAENGTTILKTVEYTSGTNTYFVNGAAVALAAFEDELNAIKAGTKTGDVEVVRSGSGATAVTQHKLSTAAAS